MRIIKIIDDTGLTELKKGEIHEVKSTVQHPTKPYYRLSSGHNIAISKTKPMKYVKKGKYEVGDLVELNCEGLECASAPIQSIWKNINRELIYGIQGQFFNESKIKHAIVDDEVEALQEAHPHKELIMEFAKIAQTEEHPETWVESKAFGEWVRKVKYEPVNWYRSCQYRISEPPKPCPKIIVNGVEINAPIKKLKGVEGYFTITLGDISIPFKTQEDLVKAWKACIKPLTDYLNS